MSKEVYTAVGKAGRKTVTITTSSFDTAVRGCKAILEKNEDITSAHVINNKGTVVKVINRK